MRKITISFLMFLAFVFPMLLSYPHRTSAGVPTPPEVELQIRCITGSIMDPCEPCSLCPPLDEQAHATLFNFRAECETNHDGDIRIRGQILPMGFACTENACACP